MPHLLGDEGVEEKRAGHQRPVALSIHPQRAGDPLAALPRETPREWVAEEGVGSLGLSRPVDRHPARGVGDIADEGVRFGAGGRGGVGADGRRGESHAAKDSTAARRDKARGVSVRVSSFSRPRSQRRKTSAKRRRP